MSLKIIAVEFDGEVDISMIALAANVEVSNGTDTVSGKVLSISEVNLPEPTVVSHAHAADVSLIIGSATPP